MDADSSDIGLHATRRSGRRGSIARYDRRPMTHPIAGRRAPPALADPLQPRRARAAHAAGASWSASSSASSARRACRSRYTGRAEAPPANQARRQPAGWDRAARRGASRRTSTTSSRSSGSRRRPSTFPRALSCATRSEVWHGFPSAASQLRGAEYEVEVAGDDSSPPTRCAAPSSGCWPRRS